MPFNCRFFFLHRQTSLPSFALNSKSTPNSKSNSKPFSPQDIIFSILSLSISPSLLPPILGIEDDRLLGCSSFQVQPKFFQRRLTDWMSWDGWRNAFPAGFLLHLTGSAVTRIGYAWDDRVLNTKRSSPRLKFSVSWKIEGWTTLRLYSLSLWGAKLKLFNSQDVNKNEGPPQGPEIHFPDIRYVWTVHTIPFPGYAFTWNLTFHQKRKRITIIVPEFRFPFPMLFYDLGGAV